MKNLDNTYIQEKLSINKDTKIDKPTKEQIVLRKLTRALVKVFNPDLTMCTDYQGDKEKGKYYEINPETLGIGRGNSKAARRAINYFKKVEGIEVKDVNGLLSSSTVCGKGEVWIRFVFSSTGIFNGIKVSKYFYDSKVFPYDQSNVSQRGWNRWAGKAW